MQHIIKIEIMQKNPTMHKTKAISGMNIICVRQFFWIHFDTLFLFSWFAQSSWTTRFILPFHFLLRKFPQLGCMEFLYRFPHVIVKYIFLIRNVITQDVTQDSVCSHLISSLNLHSAFLYASYHTDFVWRQICHTTEPWENSKVTFNYTSFRKSWYMLNMCCKTWLVKGTSYPSDYGVLYLIWLRLKKRENK